MRHIVVVSSLPLCPPASKPSATTTSTPASSHFLANFDELTTCATFMPASWKRCVYFFGLPAEVKTILHPSSIIMSMSESICGYISGRFTPQGLSVAALHFCICSLSRSTDIVPAPIRPRPPALLTAAARRQPLHQAMPPAMTGYSIPKTSCILFIILCTIYHLQCTICNVRLSISSYHLPNTAHH